jgi:hypothetical protein
MFGTGMRPNRLISCKLDDVPLASDSESLVSNEVFDVNILDILSRRHPACHKFLRRPQGRPTTYSFESFGSISTQKIQHFTGSKSLTFCAPVPKSTPGLLIFGVLTEEFKFGIYSTQTKDFDKESTSALICPIMIFRCIAHERHCFGYPSLSRS